MRTKDDVVGALTASRCFRICISADGVKFFSVMVSVKRATSYSDRVRTSRTGDDPSRLSQIHHTVLAFAQDGKFAINFELEGTKEKTPAVEVNGQSCQAAGGGENLFAIFLSGTCTWTCGGANLLRWVSRPECSRVHDGAGLSVTFTPACLVSLTRSRLLSFQQTQNHCAKFASSNA